MKKSIYLDYAASTPLDPAVLNAMKPFFSENFYNPSAIYLAAKAVRKSLNESRAVVAALLGAKPPEIVFTAGATEANNLAIQGVMKRYPEGEVLVSSIEHESVRTPAWLFDCREIPVTETGLVRLPELEKMITDKTVLISVGLINNEIGTLQPLSEISRLVKKILKDRLEKGNKNPLYFHTDAAQAGSYLSLNTSRLGVDLLSLNGGKIYGPKQSGVLFVKTGVNIMPLIGGGEQEWGMRAGTENVTGIIGLSKALEVAQAKRADENQRLSKLRKEFINGISARIKDFKINGDTKHVAPHIVSLTLPGYDNERMMMELDELGVQCATGSACSASSSEPSHVLSAIGLTSNLAHATLRFSMGRHTSGNNIQKAVLAIEKITGTNR